MEQSLDLLPFVVEAMGGCKTIYDDIDKLYQTNRYKFYKYAKQHKFYTHPIITGGSLLQEEYCKKVLGIIICARKNEDWKLLQKVDKLINKGYHWTYLYVKNHNKIDVQGFINAYRKKFHNYMDNSNIPVDYHFIMLLFLAMNHGKEIIKDDAYNNMIMGYIKMLEHYEDSSAERISLEKLTPEDTGKINVLKNSIYKKYGVIKKFDDLRVLDKRVASTGIPKFEQCSLLFDFENISSISIFDNINFTEQDIDKILCLYVLSEENLSDTEKALTFLVNNMYILYLIKAYKQVKQMYFENNKETMYIELDGLESRLKAAETERNAITDSFNKGLSEIESLHRENKRLKAELEKERKNKNELNALRDFIFTLDEREEYSDVNIPLEDLKAYKAVIIGGHEKWQQKMKEYLPNFIFIQTDNLNFDVKLLESVKVVYVFTNYLNHAIYYRLMSAIENKDIKVVYLKNQNEELVLKDIYKGGLNE